jgi:Rrf2 family transcriptional regulator, nitric oxide-sensitive transcriptional repressor
MKLQVATRIALYAVLDLAADPEKQLSGAEIAERFDVSGHHLSKVLRSLVRAGLVEAVRGAGGGYRFRGNAKRLTLLDVIEVFEPVAPDAEEEREPGAATVPGRALGRVMAEIDAIARATLSSISIATMLKLVQAESAAPAPAARAEPGRARRRNLVQG